MEVNDQPLPIQAIAQATAERGDTAMLEFLFSEGAVLDEEVEIGVWLFQSSDLSF